MALRAKPDDIKLFAVIFVMAVHVLDGVTDRADAFLQSSVSDGVVDGGLRPVGFGMGRAPSLGVCRTLCPSLRCLIPQAVIRLDVRIRQAPEFHSSLVTSSTNTGATISGVRLFIVV